MRAKITQINKLVNKQELKQPCNSYKFPSKAYNVLDKIISQNSLWKSNRCYTIYEFRGLQVGQITSQMNLKIDTAEAWNEQFDRTGIVPRFLRSRLLEKNSHELFR